MMRTLTLRGSDLVAAGKQRAVYLHPHDGKMLIKVLRAIPDHNGRSSFTVYTERWFRSLRSRTIRKEYLEYLRLMLANQHPSFEPPISHMFGFVATNEGLGCLTEKVNAPDGALGNTLADVIRQDRLSAAHVTLLNQTIKDLFKLDIRASDLTASNLVFGHRDNGTGPGPLECVLVDGFGDIHAIPVRSMARWSNRLGLNDSCKRLARNTGLHWHPKSQEFSIPA